MKEFTEKVLERESLTIPEMEQASEALFSEDTDDREKSGFLVALKARGEAVSELTGLAKVMQEKSLSIPRNFTDVMDNCGTGGDGSQTFNISTTSAFVLAGAGVTVAKHGNRSISSKTGSADVLEELGVQLSASPEEMAHILEENGIAFLFAQRVHPAMKAVMPVRKALGFPTLFNLIGPLTNPVPLTSQLLGVYRKDVVRDMAEVLHHLGRERAVVIHGAGGLDEASLTGENTCALLDKGEITEFTFTPEEVRLNRADQEELVGGNAQENAQILLSILNGEKGAKRDVVVLNAALGLYANGKAKTIQAGVCLAEESIDSGAALQKLEGLVEAGKKAKHDDTR